MFILNYLLCLLILMVSFSASADIESITITPKSTNTINSLQVPFKFTAPFSDNINAIVDIGDSISMAVVNINASSLDNFRITLQLETSLSIQDEGPHLDLIDWKHCTTVWQPVSVLKPLSFQLPNFDDINLDCFPQLTLDEVKAEVLKQGGTQWLSTFERNIANELANTNHFNMLSNVSLSKARIKIEQLIGIQWRVVTVIHFDIPMGC